jgi:DNA-directed RNA polymerase subunit M
MQFCKSCGALLVGNSCTRCGIKSNVRINLEASEKVESAKEIAVVKDGNDEVNPIVEIECPKCKNKEAFFWTKQTRSSDEAETKFYRCTKCKHTWREYR